VDLANPEMQWMVYCSAAIPEEEPPNSMSVQKPKTKIVFPDLFFFISSSKSTSIVLNT
jgi:hypothetical protein